MKTSELTGAALDWAVAHCVEWSKKFPIFVDGAPASKGNYSTDWAQGGAIIDRENIAMSSKPDGLWAAYAPKGTRLVQHGGRAVEVFNWTFKQEGYTPLIAAMRCYVASKLGDEVELPEELDHEDR
jgi:hypothetical protein